MQARSCELLRLTGRERVLEIGTGSGYQTALLSMLAETVFSVERIAELARHAHEVIRSLGLANVTHHAQRRLARLEARMRRTTASWWRLQVRRFRIRWSSN